MPTLDPWLGRFHFPSSTTKNETGPRMAAGMPSDLLATMYFYANASHNKSVVFDFPPLQTDNHKQYISFWVCPSVNPLK